jgi:uncharacterized protein YcaQ
MVEHLMFLQLDPTAAIAPSADLVAWSRLGASYRPEHLTEALERDRALFELNALVRPMSDLPLFLAEMSTPPYWASQQAWLDANARFRRDVLARLRAEGPLLSREVPDTSQVPWSSTGWTGNRNVTQMLELLTSRGEVAVAGRRGKQRLWDIAERVYPAGVEPLRAEEAATRRNERRLRSLGIARATARVMPTEPVHVGEAGEPAVVEGVKGEWRVDPEALERPFRGRTALLSPFDRLIHDRVRAEELLDFEYLLEMYKPKDARRWGYFALPVLHDDRLVGKLDATADRKGSVLRIHALHPDVRLTKAIATAVRQEIDALAAWLGLEAVVEE